uniref:Uncharacterized protein n=1 Tax=Timema shepardi TaxID=629360 RepID=A0A7R9AYQ4_TIMSH|nr:unnamed protein product [Timema shepardi]
MISCTLSPEDWDTPQPPNCSLTSCHRQEDLVPPSVNDVCSLSGVNSCKGGIQNRFKTETKRRFKLFESLVIWAQHPVNRIRVRTNLAIISLLAVFTGAMLTLGLMGMKHFINNDSPVSKTQVWMNSVVVSFMGVIVLGFWISIYLIARDELGPWYHWWTRCVNVNLILDDGPHPAA